MRFFTRILYHKSRGLSSRYTEYHEVFLSIIRLSPLLFPFLTTKPPLAFAVFVVLALFIKRRERKFIKSGKTKEEYREFLETNANSWHFSVHAAVIMVIAVVADFAGILLLVIVYIEGVFHVLCDKFAK